MSRADRMPVFYRLVSGSFYYIFRFFFGCRSYGTENVPRDGACIVASNHASYLDPPLIASSINHRPFRFMARDTLFRWPLGWALRNLCVMPLSRDRGDVGALRLSLKLLKEGRMVALFPEGTRTPDGALQEARGGVGFLVSKAKVPVVPVYVDGTFRAWPKNGRLRRARIRIIYGKPIPPETWPEDGEDLYRDIGRALMAKIAELRDRELSAHGG